MDDPEQMDVDPPPPPLLSSVSTVPTKATSSSQPESKSKLDSIISRLGSAKKTENILKKDKSSNEWKEVQLQISESGVMSVTDISSIDKLINSIDKNIGLTVPKKGIAQKVETAKVDKSDDKKSNGESKPEEKCAPPQTKIVNSGKPINQDGKDEKDVEAIRSDKSTKAAEHTQNETIGEVIKMPPARKDDEKKLPKPDNYDSNTLVPAKTCSLSKGPAVVSSSEQNSSVKKAPIVSTLPSSSQSNVTSVSGVTAPDSTKSCSISPVTGESIVSTASCTISPVTSQGIVSSAALVSLSSSTVPVSKCVTKPSSLTNSALTTITVARTAPVPIAKPAPTSQPYKKSSSSPVGYKTLKCGPKNWHPSISRDSVLSSKADQQTQQQGNSSGTGSGQGGSGKPATPAKFFKMRTTPRFLGNPASGVKAMYQIPESKPETPPPAKSPSVMKLDPRTLTPIVSNAPSLTSKSSPTQPKARPPFPSTTLSAQVSNHMPSSRVVATTTTTSSSATKHTDLASLRNSPTQSLVNPFHFPHNPYLPKGMPNFLYGPGLLPMLSPGLGYPPVTASGFHQTLPQPSILFNSHTLHGQLNSSSPGSPTGYSTSLPSPSLTLSPSSSLSSPSSTKLYPASQRTVSTHEKGPVTFSSQSSPSRSNRNTSGASFGSQGSAKVNGLELMKSLSVNQEKTALLSSEERKLEGKAKACASKDVRTTTPSASDNNNTLPSRVKSQPEKTDAGKLSLDVSNLVPKESGKCSDEQMTRAKTPASTSVQAQQS